jgi:hypothetical protein
MRLTLLLVIPFALRAQQVRLVRLDKPAATHPAEWTDVAAVRELKDGRLVVLDAREQ